MNILSRIISFFHKSPVKQTDDSRCETEWQRPNTEVAVKVNDEPILYTFHRLGPEYLTYRYPVDADCYKEIYNKDGLIGPDAYVPYPGALQAMKDNDNMWFMDEGNEQVLEMLKNDLLALARKYNKVGAYSLLGSVCYFEREKYWKVGAELGSEACMADYAIYLYTHGKTADGFRWLKKSADAGCSLAQMMVAISYNYGTLSEINYSKAAQYYIMSDDDGTNFYKYLNLGVLLVDSGYYHTAARMFKKMMDVSCQNIREILSFGHFDEYRKNSFYIEDIFSFPYSERRKHIVIQEHSRQLDCIFCSDYKSPLPFVKEIVDAQIEKWIPSPEQIDIDPRDIEERKQLPASQGRSVDKHEDYLFLSIPVKITNPDIHGTQQELIFLEKNCHAELNKYIQEHLTPLRAMLKKLGYSLRYLPTHQNDLPQQTDILGSYMNDYGSSYWEKIGVLPKEHTEQEYWESLVPSQTLPNDCAGFLRYVPNMDNLEDNTNYEYILFPYHRGTDWQRAFSEFIALMHTKPIVPVYEKEKPLGLLPSGSFLEISEEYNFVFKDNTGAALAGITMPTLSKVLYMLFLNHPEGIVLKNLIDYREELMQLYQQAASNKAKPDSIDVLCDPTNNSANEKLSRIKSAFTKALEKNYKNEIPTFIPQGKRGEAIIVSVERGRVKMKSNIYIYNMANCLEKTLSNLQLCDQKKQPLSESQKDDFWKWVDSLCSSKKVCLVYRGTSKLKEQYNVDLTNIPLLSEMIFMVGEKAYGLWEDCKCKIDFINSHDENVFDYIWNIFHEKVCKLNFDSQTTKDRVRTFLEINPEIKCFFENNSNNDNFLSFSCNKSSESIKDYYLSLLHTIGKSGDGNSCYLSSSLSFNVAEEFQDDGIIIIGWIPKKGKNKRIIKYSEVEKVSSKIAELKLPVSKIPVYPKQHEICLKCGILPHYIIGYIYKDQFIVNPETLNEWNSNIPVEGLKIDQKCFNEIISKTNYGRSYIFCDGLYLGL